MTTRRSVTFEVVGIAQPKGSTKAFLPKGSTRPIVTADNPRTKDWQQLVAAQAQHVADGGLFLDAVALRIVFYLPRPVSLPRRVAFHVKKPDLDKLIRATNDALTGILYRDDSQVVDVSASKWYAHELTAPRAVITVAEFEPRARLVGTLVSLFPEDSAHEPTPIP